MKIVRVNRAGGSFEVTEESTREPARGTVRIRVQACGVCHSDVLTKAGGFPGIVYPRAPGHEIAGVVDAVGEAADPWKAGDRVGVGWHGGHCGKCNSCRRGDFITCELTPEEAAPLMCAGVTTFNALRNSGARPGDLVAVQGIGGLGHLGVQFASKFGFATVAIGRGADKKPLALKLGARTYIDSAAQDVSKELAGLGGASAILATAPDGKAMGSLIDGLGAGGKLIIVGVSADPFSVSSLQLIGKHTAIVGWPSGTSIDSEDTLRFAAASGVRAMIETFPLERAADAYEHMLSGKVRFRSVLKI
jgi:D-arabinose 1-dehydrogenase-like Zn-dependent alcohol dehydrogenase